MAVSGGVQGGWNVGGRVSANFSVTDLYGDGTNETWGGAHGGAIQGTLTKHETYNS